MSSAGHSDAAPHSDSMKAGDVAEPGPRPRPGRRARSGASRHGRRRVMDRAPTVAGLCRERRAPLPRAITDRVEVRSPPRSARSGRPSARIRLPKPRSRSERERLVSDRASSRHSAAKIAKAAAGLDQEQRGVVEVHAVLGRLDPSADSLTRKPRAGMRAMRPFGHCAAGLCQWRPETRGSDPRTGLGRIRPVRAPGCRAG